ncbi:hypothetical protein G9F71_008570 [Clostridium sp. FP2]|uniref:hypothetical protein n=1 Tax=Clostridium sp. FP2 TaxID=2724481 RepID=UPI0013E93E39|nr:hypothetical protein [Clostridium sp. FP2]MBZ9622906.1 hypothetical protein [Clostridium sp. FP2]
MSDKITIVAMICATSLGMATIVFISTYLKDRLTVKSKTSIKDVVNSEIAITTENSDKSTKN